MNFQTYIRDVPDFPKPGIIFKDITPLLKDPEALSAASQALYELVESPIDKVVGIDSRGFIFAPVLALKLNAGFVPVRKKGKLPHGTESAQYSLEYGEDKLEIHKDAIRPGDRVLVHDDVLATGGTASAVCGLVEKLGGTVVQCNFLITLDFLGGRKKLKDHKITSLIEY